MAQASGLDVTRRIVRRDGEIRYIRCVGAAVQRHRTEAGRFTQCGRIHRANAWRDRDVPDTSALDTVESGDVYVGPDFRVAIPGIELSENQLRTDVVMIARHLGNAWTPKLQISRALLRHGRKPDGRGIPTGPLSRIRLI